jgi:hypothetical protein
MAEGGREPSFVWFKTAGTSFIENFSSVERDPRDGVASEGARFYSGPRASCDDTAEGLRWQAASNRAATRGTTRVRTSQSRAPG